jgi:hypothetical protein
MALDPDTKKPIICTHQDYEKVDAEHWSYVCNDCGLKFRYEPQQIDRASGRKSRVRRR